jgi:hypothetical protein
VEESLTQATFVDKLMVYITNNPMKDRDLIKRGKLPPGAEGEESKRLIFRNMFLEKRDAEIAKTVWDYFKAVELRWPEAWPHVTQGNILNRTTGFAALMRFLRDAYLSLGGQGETISVDQFEEIFKKMDILDNEFNSQRYKTGTGGEAKLYKDLLEQSHLGAASADPTRRIEF